MSDATRGLAPYIAGLAIAVIVLFAASAGWSQDDESSYMDSYTGADAARVGSATCEGCHADRKPAEGESTHDTLFDNDESSDYYGYGCEACHGPGGNHNGVATGILSFEKMSVDEVTDRCTMCHADQGTFKLEDWQGGRHLAAGKSCINCHSGHSANDYFLVKETDVELCSSCHTDIGEAFANGDHGAPGTDMTCTDCHNPHD